MCSSRLKCTTFILQNLEPASCGGPYLCCCRYQAGHSPPGPSCTFPKHWNASCEQAWRRNLLMLNASVPIFMAMLILAAWIKFNNQTSTAIIMTIVLAGGLAFCGRIQSQWVPRFFLIQPLTIAKVCYTLLSSRKASRAKDGQRIGDGLSVCLATWAHHSDAIEYIAVC